MRKNKNVKNKSGFTMMELLVVIAIVVVLVAISISIFTKQLEKSRETTDVANMRAAKAAILVTHMTDETKGAFFYDADKGTLVKSKPDAYGKGTNTSAGVKYSANEDCTSCTYNPNASYRNKCIRVSVDEDGNYHVHWERANDLYSVFKEIAASTGAKDFAVANSSYKYDKNPTINKIKEELGKLGSDIKTWALIADPGTCTKDAKNADIMNYLFSTYDISDYKNWSEGDQIPAIMQKSSSSGGGYTVGYATLRWQDNANYVISHDGNNKVRDESGTSGTMKNPDYNIDTVISGGKTFDTLDEAYDYYDTLSVKKK